MNASITLSNATASRDPFHRSVTHALTHCFRAWLNKSGRHCTRRALVYVGTYVHASVRLCVPSVPFPSCCARWDLHGGLGNLTCIAQHCSGQVRGAVCLLPASSHYHFTIVARSRITVKHELLLSSRFCIYPASHCTRGQNNGRVMGMLHEMVKPHIRPPIRPTRVPPD